MPKILYILRHGIAVPHGTPDIEEDSRPLTSKGERRVKQIAGGLSRLGVNPDQIVTSPLPRAHRTAEIVARRLAKHEKVETAEALLPSATAHSIADWLKSRDAESLMIVGHNPSLTRLVGLLIGITAEQPPFELKKAGLASLTAIGTGEDHYQLNWLATPRLLRKLDL